MKLIAIFATLVGILAGPAGAFGAVLLFLYLFAARALRRRSTGLALVVRPGLPRSSR